MRLSLELLVIAIVILVVAVVIISFFALGMQQANQLMDARNQCITTASASCRSVKVMPPTWEIATVRVGERMMSCKELTDKSECDQLGVTTGGETEVTTPVITTKKQCEDGGGECKPNCGTKRGIGTCSDDPVNGLCCER